MAVQEARRIVPVNEVGNEDETALAPSGRSEAMMQVAVSRAAQEVQAAMVVAKKFPRDIEAARKRILTECKRKGVAEASQYTFPRGGQTVNGPSIRMAEVLARNFGNIETGVVELERRDGVSTAMSYAWDLETNARDVKVFEVRHIRDTKGGGKRLTDERDIYELLANTGARRKRACILTLIPSDIVDEAIIACDKTMQGDNTEPLIDRIRKMVAFFEEMEVTPAMIERRLGHKIEVTTASELVTMKKIAASIRDNMAPIAQFFDVPAEAAANASEKTSALNEKLKGNGAAMLAGDDAKQAAEKIEQARKSKTEPKQEPDTEPDFELSSTAEKCWSELTAACNAATGLDGPACGTAVRKWLKSVGLSRNALTAKGSKGGEAREEAREQLALADWSKFV